MKTQAWGWLVAAVLAAGLNASYHDGRLEWAHQIAGSIEHSSSAVLALATGHADRFLAEAQMLGARQETASCRWSTALARVQTRVARSQARADRFNERFEAMSAREEAAMARVEADRARIEAEVARMQVPDADFAPAMVSLRKVSCPRVRLTMPEVPRIEVPHIKMPVAPVIHVNVSSAGPV
ncbi:MAG TPA: hypothetical protein VE866_03735 [Candidatus Binatia bacterium]|nr:hypothetical protein [Candidatus Binatia bacterium]